MTKTRVQQYANVFADIFSVQLSSAGIKRSKDELIHDILQMTASHIGIASYGETLFRLLCDNMSSVSDQHNRKKFLQEFTSNWPIRASKPSAAAAASLDVAVTGGLLCVTTLKPGKYSTELSI